MNTLSWSEARAAVESAVHDHARRGTEMVPVADAAGRILASAVVSPMDVPHYTSSAMDGFAVRGSGPWRLLATPVEGAAGRNVHRTGGVLSDGEALPVLTGSLLPEGAEAVVRSEDAEITCDGSRLHARQPDVGKDIRPAGQERAAGSELLAPGVRLTPRHIAMLSAGGVDEVTVTVRPTVVCAFTGNEIVRSGVPGPGEVRDAFSTSFPALVESWGGVVTSTEAIADDPVAVEYWLRRPSTVDADIVLVTGGSGHSGQDFARRFITRAVAGDDGEVLASGVACRPGHPTLIARRGAQLIIGAPGNPFAAHVALHSFVMPAIAAFVGASSELHSGVCAVSLDPLDRDRVRLIPASLGADRVCTPVDGAHSHMLTGYATGDVLLVVPSGGLAAGEPVDYLML
ncbi:molybdopterin molybdotransferase MoeA [Corynebacterium variabile]|uniref:molybdopterin molybdotransferase MoeA n=1 Tax=Corynebacterium variabile TaxID=1727 RepID=UPI00289F53F9|nr:molybdopterin molybdotransferase MoeA [Corynebacterium variabile]